MSAETPIVFASEAPDGAIVLRVDRRALAALLGISAAAPSDPIVGERDEDLARVAGITPRQMRDRCRTGRVHGAIRTAARGWTAPLSEVRRCLEVEQAARRNDRAPKTNIARAAEQASVPRRDPLAQVGTPRRQHGGDRTAA